MVFRRPRLNHGRIAFLNALSHAYPAALSIGSTEPRSSQAAQRLLPPAVAPCLKSSAKHVKTVSKTKSLERCDTILTHEARLLTAF